MTKPIEVSLDQATTWADESDDNEASLNYNYELAIARKAAQWGADQELEACCKSLRRIWDMEHCTTLDGVLRELLRCRRPKPLSLKEQARHALDVYVYGNPDHQDKERTYNILRSALDSLPN